MPKPASLEIVKYEFMQINGNPKVVISMVKVLDEENKYIKFAKLKEVLPYLAEFPVKFKPIEQREK